MTLIVGIICADGIVMGSDTQTTYSAYGTKLLDQNKFSIVRFRDSAVLVGESGSVNLANRTIQIFEKKAKEINSQNSDDVVAQTLKEAIRETRNERMSIETAGAYSLEGWQKFFMENGMSLMVAYYFKETPLIYKVSIDDCIPIKCPTHFSCAGCGESFGAYLLNEFSSPGMDSAIVSTLAVKAIDESTKYVDGCGLPIKLAWLKAPKAQPKDFLVMPYMPMMFEDYICIFPSERVEEIVQMIRRTDISTKADRVKEFETILKANIIRYLRHMFKLIKKRNPRLA